ncbi:MAG: hypothetical protein M3O87_06180 [Candidatus Dormibacteraeota bacterium]|nr:hypothetical protein [Candidatus Dormibacteraeota bacterium]
MPKFNRISLQGSEELFRPTALPDDDPEPLLPAERYTGRAIQPPRAPQRAPLASERRYIRLQLTEGQVQELVEAVQRMKYPHMAAAAQQPSMEEFEALEALRNVLLDSLE